MSLLSTVKRVFGSAFHVSRGYSLSHDGIDLPAREGTPIYAVAAGVVEYARDARIDPKCGTGWACGGGNVVNINIGGRQATQYAHLQKMTVSLGERVSKGQLIGYVGRTGGKTASGAYGKAGSTFSGPHLHFGLWDKTSNKMINPLPFLEASTGGGGGGGGSLAGFNSLVSFPIGHIITSKDIKDISIKLDKAGWFGNVPLVASVRQIAFEEFLVQNAKGKAWTKDLQNKLAGQANADASNIGGALPAVPDIPGAITGAVGSLVMVATYVIAVVFIVVGLWLYSKGTKVEATETYG